MDEKADSERSVTGDACVSALIRAGFKVRHRGNGLALLARAGNIVMVPDVGVLEPYMLRAILRSAGVSQTELDLHLANVPSRSGFFLKTPADATVTSSLSTPPFTKRRST